MQLLARIQSLGQSPAVAYAIWLSCMGDPNANMPLPGSPSTPAAIPSLVLHTFPVAPANLQCKVSVKHWTSVMCRRPRGLSFWRWAQLQHF